MRIHVLVLIVMAFGSLSCKKESGPWARFIECSSNACVAEAIAVKDAFLEDPKSMLEQFAKTYEKGEDHVVGWIYLLRDSVLLNGSFAEPQARFDLQQAIIQAAKPYENDPKLGEMAKSVLGEVEMLAIASEMEEEIPTEIVPFAGTYSYELPNEAGSGELKISVVNSGSVRFALSVVGRAPSFNQGMMEGIAQMTAYNQFEYQTSEFGGACKLQFVFTGNMVSVSTLEGDSPPAALETTSGQTGNTIWSITRIHSFRQPTLKRSKIWKATGCLPMIPNRGLKSKIACITIVTKGKPWALSASSTTRNAPAIAPLQVIFPASKSLDRTNFATKSFFRIAKPFRFP
ncbi:MAG: hypothetical protein IPH16_16950 [Haliscomenobacter sp.]|nr:hypothetical protein [Haliscomenobacter sp.]